MRKWLYYITGYYALGLPAVAAFDYVWMRHHSRGWPYVFVCFVIWVVCGLFVRWCVITHLRQEEPRASQRL